MSAIRAVAEVVSLTVLRLSLAAWVGAAALFVITSVAEQIAPQFDSVIRDQLATIRFPLYYQFGFGLLAVAVVSCLGVLASGSRRRRKRMLIVLGLTLLSATGEAIDYVWVYRPLQELITPPGKAREQQFVRLHQRSRQANEVHLTLAFLAAVAACVPATGRLVTDDFGGSARDH